MDDFVCPVCEGVERCPISTADEREIRAMYGDYGTGSCPLKALDWWLAVLEHYCMCAHALPLSLRLRTRDLLAARGAQAQPAAL